MELIMINKIQMIKILLIIISKINFTLKIKVNSVLVYQLIKYNNNNYLQMKIIFKILLQLNMNTLLKKYNFKFLIKDFKILIYLTPKLVQIIIYMIFNIIK